MIDFRRALIAPAFALALAALAAPATWAQNEGNPLPPSELVDFSKTAAASIDDYAGRLVLIEFFAYW